MNDTVTDVSSPAAFEPFFIIIDFKINNILFYLERKLELNRNVLSLFIVAAKFHVRLSLQILNVERERERERESHISTTQFVKRITKL